MRARTVRVQRVRVWIVRVQHAGTARARARIASFYWREKEKERVGGYEEEEEEEEEEEDNWLVGDPLSHRL